MDKATIVITGGAGGLGTSCARALQAYKLVITDYAQDAVDRAVADLRASGADAEGFACDISDERSVARLVEFSKRQGPFRGLVHTAGVSGTGGDPQKVFTIDLLATALLLDAFYGLATPGSAVVLFSSMMGHVVPPDPRYDGALRDSRREGAYAVIEPFLAGSADNMYNFAKRGVLLLCKDNAMRFGRMGARIVSVSPGVIMTPMAKKALEEHPEVMRKTLDMTPVGRYGLPGDVASLVAFLISDGAGFITGTDIVVDGGVLTQMLK